MVERISVPCQQVLEQGTRLGWETKAIEWRAVFKGLGTVI